MFLVPPPWHDLTPRCASQHGCDGHWHWQLFSPLLPRLLDQPVDGEGEEVIEEDEDADEEKQQVDDHLESEEKSSSSSWRPRGKSSLDCRRPAAQETYTQHTLSIQAGQTSYLLQDVSIFGSTWLWLSTQDVCTSILHLSTPHISRQTLRLFCFLLFFTIVVLIKSHKIHTLYFTHIPWSSMLFDI